jgi:hypothetical protein
MKIPVSPEMRAALDRYRRAQAKIAARADSSVDTTVRPSVGPRGEDVAGSNAAGKPAGGGEPSERWDLRRPEKLRCPHAQASGKAGTECDG